MHSADRAAGEAAAGLGGLRPVRLRRGDLARGAGRPRGHRGHQPAEGARQECLLRHQQQQQDPQDVRRQDDQAGLQRAGGGGVRHRVLLRRVPAECVRAAGESLPDRQPSHGAGAGGRGDPADRGGTGPCRREGGRLGRRAPGPRGEGGGGRLRRALQLHEAEPSPAVPEPEGLPVRGDQQGLQAAPGGRQGSPRYRLPAPGRRNHRPAPGPDCGQTQQLHVRLCGLPVQRGPRPLPDGGRPPGHGHHAGLQLRPEDPPHPHGGQHGGRCRGPPEERLCGEAGDGAGLLRGEHRRSPPSSAGMRAPPVGRH